MSTLTRRLLTLLLCCWLPLPGVALATVDCHLLSSTMASHDAAKTDQIIATELSAGLVSDAADEHSGCGTAKKNVAQTTAQTETHTPCNHCQMACHNAQFLLAPSSLHKFSLDISPAPDYAMPLPQLVFLKNPQRPPQA